ncbi:alpha/beta fold hydrolase [Thalassolituus sp. LLYu03]|uniref:alpha/beta fold hydrolase n=1 Tax=Thalassolituus sp. LLYu03 TaxID=3421656 RepID=UPI003D2CE980
MKDILHFSHANGFPSGCYRVLFEHLSAHFDVRSIDRLGHNPAYPVTDNWTHLEQELTHYFEQHYRRPVIAVGHSLGGVLSLMVARSRPDLVKSVILLDAPALTPMQSAGLRLAKRFGLVDRVTPAGRTDGRRRQWTDHNEALSYFSGKTLMKDFTPECLNDYVQAATVAEGDGIALYFDPDTEMRIYRTVPHNLTFRAPLAVPGAAVGGRQSRVFTRMNGAYMQSRLGMKVVWTEGSHMFPFEHPQQTADQIIALAGQLNHD